MIISNLQVFLSLRLRFLSTAILIFASYMLFNKQLHLFFNGGAIIHFELACQDDQDGYPWSYFPSLT